MLKENNVHVNTNPVTHNAINKEDQSMPEDDGIKMSGEVEEFMDLMKLDGDARASIQKVYDVKVNLGEYPDFFPELKGKRFRMQLWLAIQQDIMAHIVHEDWRIP